MLNASGPKRILVHGACWIAYVLFFVLFFGSLMNEYWQPLVRNVLQLPVKLSITYLIIYILLPQLLRGRYWLFGLSVHGLVLAGGLLQQAISLFLVDPYFGPRPAGKAYFDWPGIFFNALNTYAIVAVATSVKLVEYWYRQQRISQRMQQEKLESELNYLKAQIHPHFLFNTLNNLYGLSIKNSPYAPEMILKLSDLLHYMLYEANRERVPLEKEIRYLKHYIELEKLRYGSRLDVSFRVGRSLKGNYIAPLLIIPFLENSFKHGAQTQEEDAWIDVGLTVEGNQLVVRIENNYASGEGTSAGGFGLANVRKRLDLLYPGRYKLQIEAKATFTVLLTITLTPVLDKTLPYEMHYN